MVRPALRIVPCVLVGLLVGWVLGPLFVPDPTGTLSAILSVGVMAMTSIFLYRSKWLRGRASVV